MTREELITLKKSSDGLPYVLKSLERDSILFKWKSNTEGFKLPFQPELYLTMVGSIGWNKKDNCWVYGNFEELRDEYGDYTTYICQNMSTTNKRTYELKNHEEVIVCGNTPLYRSRDYERSFYSDLKKEADISIRCQLLNSRLNKAIVAQNDNQKKQIDKAYEAIKLGFPMVIVTDLLEDLNIIDLTDPDDIEKMQYLSSFYQSIEKREANDIGVDLELIDKRAQVTSNEIKQYDDVTTLEYLTMYEMRKAFVEEMKENGYDIEIVGNPVYFDEPKDEDIDNGTFEEAEIEDTENNETPEDSEGKPGESEEDNGDNA